MDRSALAFGAATSAALEAEDAYIDIASDTADAVYVKIEITPPGGTNTHHLFSLRVHLQVASGPTDQFAPVVVRQVRYLAGETAAYEIEIMAVDNSGSNTFDRIKIDAFNLRTISGGTVTAGDTPTMKVKKITISDLNKTISVS